MDSNARTDMTTDGFGQRRQQEQSLSDPVGERRAVQFHIFTEADPCLAVQRDVVAVFRHDDMGDQSRPRAPALDRQRGHWRLDDGLAGSAAQLGAKMPNDFEAGRDIFQHITLVLPDAAEHGAAAAWANADRIVGDDFTRKMLG
jgi:hypothetical protein